MAQYAKEIGLLWAFCVSWVLINAADERGRSIFLSQGSNSGISNVSTIINTGSSSGSSFINIQSSAGSSNINTGSNSGSISMTIQSSVVSNNNNNNGSSLDGHFQGCESYTEYKDLVQLANDLECHSLDIVFPKLRALHGHMHGPDCMHDVIGKLKTYFTSHHNSKGCKCSGRVVYHPEKYHIHPWTCTNRNHNFDDINAHLFGNDSHTGPCVPVDKVWILFSSLPTNLDNNSLDCQWEIIKHYTTILDANRTRCSCSHEPINVHTTPPHTDSMSTTMSPTTSENTPMNVHTTPPQADSMSTTMSPTTTKTTQTLTVPHTCKKASTISTLGHGIKQTNPEAGSCHPQTNDHVAPEALVISMCSVTNHSETWTRGQNVMSVCERIPLYTPVATFFDGKYSNQGGLAGIFVGCLQDGFKMIVQECDKNITVMHVVTGGHFQLDPINYSIIM